MELIGIGPLLDIGCGEGVWTKQYASKAEYAVGCDISETAISRARIFETDSLSFFSWDVCKRFEKEHHGVYSTVLLNEVLYYIDPKYQKSVALNIAELLGKDGVFVLSVGHYFEAGELRSIFNNFKFLSIEKVSGANDKFHLLMTARLP